MMGLSSLSSSSFSSSLSSSLLKKIPKFTKDLGCSCPKTTLLWVSDSKVFNRFPFIYKNSFFTTTTTTTTTTTVPGVGSVPVLGPIQSIKTSKTWNGIVSQQQQQQYQPLQKYNNMSRNDTIHWNRHFLKKETVPSSLSSLLCLDSFQQNGFWNNQKTVFLPQQQQQQQNDKTTVSVSVVCSSSSFQIIPWKNNTSSWMTRSAFPTMIGWIESVDDNTNTMDSPSNTTTTTTIPYDLLNRNARRGKRANSGKRPCSRQRRRKKKRAFGSHRR